MARRPRRPAPGKYPAVEHEPVPIERQTRFDPQHEPRRPRRNRPPRPEPTDLCTKCGLRVRTADLTVLSGQGRSVVRQQLCRPCLEVIAPKLVPFQHHREKKDKELRKKYGISVEDYEALLVHQSGACGVCLDRPKLLVVDHDHATGEVRGLLCNTCNIGLGSYRDDPKRLARAILYLLGDSWVHRQPNPLRIDRCPTRDEVPSWVFSDPW